MTEIFMPKAGMDMKEGRLIRWLNEVGDPVEKDEPVMEIETDKITMEAEAPGSGILLAKTVEEDTWVPVLSVIGYIGEPGEKIPEAPAASPKAPEPSQREEAPLPSVPGGSAEPAALAPPEKKSREAQTGPSAEREAGRRLGRPEAEPVRSVCGQSYSCHALREESRPGKGTGFKGHCSRQKRRRYPRRRRAGHPPGPADRPGSGRGSVRRGRNRLPRQGH